MDTVKLASVGPIGFNEVLMIRWNALWEAYKTLCADLLAERTAQGHWEGRLASSALATATAIGALSLVLHHRKASGHQDPFAPSVQTSTGRAGRASGQQPEPPDPSEEGFADPSGLGPPGPPDPAPPGPSEPELTGLSALKHPGTSDTEQSGISEAKSSGPSTAEMARLIHAGLEWLARTQNPDGGWGDTDRSPSNIATTMLVRAAVHLADLVDWNGLAMEQARSTSSSGCQPGASSSSGLPSRPFGSTDDQASLSGSSQDRVCQSDSAGRWLCQTGSAGASGGSAQRGQPISCYAQKPTQRFARLLERAARYIEQQGGLEGLRRRYGKDQTFAVPILTMYALAGLVGWEEVRALPFEWAILPHRLLGWVRLPVVSYAIPALVAMGQARFFHLPPRNPLLRWLRAVLVEKTLQVLEAKQPASGGFLEAVPLTSFVLMALASTGRARHPVVQRGMDFLLHTFRPEGAWPIDANLATWVTTLSLNALLGPAIGPGGPVVAPREPGVALGEPGAALGEPGVALEGPEVALGEPGVGPGGAGAKAEASGASFPPQKRLGGQELFPLAAIRREIARACFPWLLECQHKRIHPFTYSPPGGWGWSDLPGAVPDADDTSGALLALAAIYRELDGELAADQRRRILQAVALGLRWLLDLQNRDGGWPTFCRGWGALPFDRSATDLTAHALRALAAWKTLLRQGAFSEAFSAGQGPVSLREIRRAIRRGLRFLARCQNPDGSWTPLWFGNAYWPGEENPIYGTARVLLAYRDLGLGNDPAAQRGRAWLLAHQNPDGGWGGRPRGVRLSSDQQADLPPEDQGNICSISPDRQPQPNPSPQPANPADWQSSMEETALALEALLTDPMAAHILRPLVGFPDSGLLWQGPDFPAAGTIAHPADSPNADILRPMADSPAAGAVGQPAAGILRTADGPSERTGGQPDVGILGPSADPNRLDPNVLFFAPQGYPGDSEGVSMRWALERAFAWLVRAVQEGRHRHPEPIGLYFARLWYYEKMYPIAFALAALGQAIACLQAAPISET